MRFDSCTQYNVLKVARHMFTWTADVKLADYYERALQNGILGNIDDRSPALPAHTVRIHAPCDVNSLSNLCCSSLSKSLR